jgi:hypothetical protein
MQILPLTKYFLCAMNAAEREGALHRKSEFAEPERQSQHGQRANLQRELSWKFRVGAVAPIRSPRGRSVATVAGREHNVLDQDILNAFKRLLKS